MVKETNAEPIIQTFAVQSLSTLKAKEELIGLQDLLGSLSDEPFSFATNLMDPRRNSAPSPRQALLEALKQFGITPKIEVEHPQAAKSVQQKKGVTQANSADKGRKTVRVCDFGGEKAKRQYGGDMDALGDAKAGSHFSLDLYGVHLRAESEGDIDLDMDFMPAPESASRLTALSEGPIDARYRILFDADRNAQTGSTIEGFPGIEREVEIIVHGNQEPGPFTVTGFIIDTLDGSKTPFSAVPSLSAEASWNRESETGLFFGMEVSIRGIPRKLLSLVADEVPVTVISQNEAGVADTAVFIFDRKAWEKEPDLRISSAAVGEPMRFTVKGLTPRKEFTVSVDAMDTEGTEEIEGTPVFTGHAGPGGTSSGSFILPALSPGDHSLYVEEKRTPDEQFRFGFNVTTCEECYAEYVKTPVAKEAYPGEAYVKYSKGSDLQDEKQPEEATPFLEEAYRLDPNNRRIIGRLAQAYSATGKHLQANSLLEELRRKFVKPSGDVSERLAYAYTIMRRYQEAIGILEDLIQKSDHPSEYAWELLGYACRESKEWMRLLEIAKFGIEKEPNSVPAYHDAGFAASMIYGLHSKESRRYYAKYRELEPDKQKSAFVKEIFPDL
ncbi:MAG: tetratricopeptide repeat protein [Candidatus Omnitrophica bacterium]|nr:tetratricopeptide repeat protein [Candidatus Omnitrophota bacterium]